MFPWTPTMDDFDIDTLPSQSPREALQPLIDKYRGLRYVIKPPRGGFGHELFLEEEQYLRPYDGRKIGARSLKGHIWRYWWV
jgi:hypothetical protein